MISIKQLSMRFGRSSAISGVDLEVATGESVALWGSNGAGKSTLLRCVLGLLRFNGVIAVGGVDVRSRGKNARMLIGYVPQEIGFHDDMTVSRAVALFAGMKRVGVREGDEALDRVGLTGHGRKRVRELSGGMKQRLALAIALLGDPPVLILDEVTASLDAQGRSEFVGLLSELAGAGRTMLFASHREDEIRTLADRVVVLSRGRIAEVRDADQFGPNAAAGSVLHLTIPPEARTTAISRLHEQGFEATLNGVGILVPVTGRPKAAPFRVLADAEVPVHDFELLPERPTHRTSAGENNP